MLSGLSKNSQANYGTGQRHFLQFGKSQRLQIRELFPPKPNLILAFLAYLFMLPAKIKYDTAKAYLCHVRNLSAMLGHDVSAFECPRLLLAVKGFQKRRPGLAATTRLPVTISLLQKFMEVLHDDDATHRTIAAALVVGVQGLFRSGELAVKDRSDEMDNLLTRANVVWSSDSVVIHLAVSKTDPFRHGTDITLYRDDSTTCPWARLRAAMAHAPLKHSSAPLFQLEDGSALTYRALNTAIKHLAECVGLRARDFSGHSLRIGGATSLAIMGVPDYVIKSLGRWKSAAYQTYPRVDEHVRKRWATSIAAQASARERNYFGGLPTSMVTSASFDEISDALKKRAATATR